MERRGERSLLYATRRVALRCVRPDHSGRSEIAIAIASDLLVTEQSTVKCQHSTVQYSTVHPPHRSGQSTPLHSSRELEPRASRLPVTAQLKQVSAPLHSSAVLLLNIVPNGGREGSCTAARSQFVECSAPLPLVADESSRDESKQQSAPFESNAVNVASAKSSAIATHLNRSLKWAPDQSVLYCTVQYIHMSSGHNWCATCGGGVQFVALELNSSSE